MTLKTIYRNLTSTKTQIGKATYKGANNSILIKVPEDINIFNNKDLLVVNRIIEGFIIRKLSLTDTKKPITFTTKRTIILDTSVDCDNNHGEYDYEIIDTDTLKLIRI